MDLNDILLVTQIEQAIKIKEANSNIKEFLDSDTIQINNNDLEFNNNDIEFNNFEDEDFLFINKDFEIVTKTEFQKFMDLLDSDKLNPIQKKLLEEKMTPLENTKTELKLQKIDNENYFLGPKLENKEFRNIKNIIETPEPFHMADGIKYIEKSYKYRQDFHIDCTFCMEKFKEGEFIFRTCCSHIIHKNCMELWLQDNNRCPVCSFNF